MDVLSLVPVAVFVLTIYLVYKHPSVKIPFTSRYVHIDYGYAPIIGVILLFLTFSIGVDSIWRGVMGVGNIRPYSILVIIVSFSYICVSLDYTGFFEYLSMRVVRISRGSGKRLFIYTFLFASFLTLFTDNNIVILTMTPIIIYTCRAAKIDPIPFLFSMFFAANIMSVTLYIGNPVNIIAADAAGLTFVPYMKWMLIPSILAEVVCLLLLWLAFRRRVPKRLAVPEIDPSRTLKDRSGALFGSTILVLSITVFSISSDVIGIAPWVTPPFFAVAMFLYDLFRRRPHEGVEGISQHSSLKEIIRRVPWKIIPFIIGLFIIVDGLDSAGWTGMLASQLSRIGSPVLMTIAVTYLSLALCNFMNNHPASIFLVRTFQSPLFAVSAASGIGSSLALLLGANFGVNLTLMGGLAGLMWAKILSDKGQSVSFSEFSKYGLLITPIVAAVACLGLAAELALWA